jgi:hypothetical protein
MAAAAFAKSTPTNHGKGRTPAPVARPAHPALTATAPPTNRCGYRKDLNRMRTKPVELPLKVARAFIRDMQACHKEENFIKRDEIAAARHMPSEFFSTHAKSRYASRT